MMYKIVIIPDKYILIVDEKGENWSTNALCYNNDGNIGQPINRESKKVIAHLPLSNSPTLKGVDLLAELPKKENSFEEITKEEEDLWCKEMGGLTSMKIVRKYISIGYKAATKLYTYKDIIKAFNYGIDEASGRLDWRTFDLIESLLQPEYPTGFETNYINCEETFYNGYKGNIRKLNNEHGIPVWQGKWIYYE